MLSIETRNFRILRCSKWTPSGVCAVVGPTGSGKTTLFSVPHFLRNAYNRTVSNAASYESFAGSWGLRSWGSTDDEPVVIGLEVGNLRWELQLITRGESLSDQTGEKVTRGEEVLLSRLPLSDRFIYKGSEFPCDERLVLRTVFESHRPDDLKSLILAITSFRTYGEYNLRGLRANGSRQSTDQYLHPSGENLFSVLRNWRERREYRDQYRFVVSGLKSAFPELYDDIDFHSAGLTVTADFLDPHFKVSCPSALAPNGWMTGLMHLTAVAGAREGSLIEIDEFENTLHPYAIRQLLNAIRDWAESHDLTVTLATHSPVLLDEFKDTPESVFVMEGPDRPVSLDTLFEKDWLSRFSLGRLFEHGEFGGQTSRPVEAAN